MQRRRKADAFTPANPQSAVFCLPVPIETGKAVVNFIVNLALS
jgi:hypothetical protein